MKREIQPKTKLSATAERDEVARLEDIDTFQRRHFAAWVDSVLSLTSLSSGEVLAVVYMAGSRGFVSDLRIEAGRDGFCSYVPIRWCVGWTLPEITTELFRFANLKTGERIPDRDVIINPKRTAAVVNMLVETHQFLKNSHF